MASIIQIRRDTASDWTSANPTLAQGELALETDTLKLKAGDGTTAWTSLAYYSLGATGVLSLTGGALTGALTTNSTIDGRDVAADGVLATNAMPKSGGDFTGAVTTNSTFDGRDVAADGVTADAALPKAGGTMSGGLAMGANTITSTGKILFSNMYAQTSDLPSASTYHGMFAHVHATGKGYFAHGGAWIELANQTDLASATTTAGNANTLATAALPKAGGTVTGLINHSDQILQRTVLKDYGETKVAMSAHAVDLELGNVFTYTLSGGQTLTFTNPAASGTACSFSLIITNGGSATLTFPSSVDWPAATAPTLTASGVDVLTFTTCDGGTIWYGIASGIGMA